MSTRPVPLNPPAGPDPEPAAAAPAATPAARDAPPPENRLPPALAWFLAIVAVPALLAAVYYGLIASDVYVAEIRFAVRSSSQAPATGFLESIIGTSGASGSGDDAKIVRDYILSKDILEELDRRMDLRRHFESENIDWYARLDQGESEEDYLDYYRGMVSIQIDSDSQITTVLARAFDPKTARELAANLLELSEDLVNRMSERITRDTLQFAREEVTEAEDKVRKAGTAVSKFRSQFQSINPGEETAAVLGIVTGLESKLAGARAELVEALSFMRADSSRVRTLRSRVEALQSQVEKERTRLASESGPDMTRLIFGYEPLALDQKLAEQQYASALTSLEAARIEAQRKQRYLIAFVSPRLPDEAIEPERARNVFIVFLLAFLVYGIGALIWSAIKEHMRI
jgi:capsular polysaccharide transport system permease protein